LGRRLTLVACLFALAAGNAQAAGYTKADTTFFMDDGTALAGTLYVPAGTPPAAGCRELHEAGHLVGSHTVSHEPMTSMDDGRIRDEWARSKEALEQILGAPVTAGSVPRGFYSRRVGRIAIAAGYDTLFTSEPRTRPRQLAGGTVYGRFSVHEGTALAHVAALGRRSRRAIVHDAAAWNARKAAKRALGPVYERLRTTRLASGRP